MSLLNCCSREKALISGLAQVLRIEDENFGLQLALPVGLYSLKVR